MTRSIGVILLVVYLALVCVLAITNLQFEFQRFLVGITAGAAAVFLARGK